MRVLPGFAGCIDPSQWGDVVVGDGRGVSAETEGPKSRTEITRAGEGVGLGGNANVGGEIVARAK